MSGVFGQVVPLAQPDGSEVLLRVSGDEHYATYETLDGYAVVYDDLLGRYCYAALDGAGAFVSTGNPATGAPPGGVTPHLAEAPSVRLAKAARSIARRAGPE